jgi:hypothetical protein
MRKKLFESFEKCSVSFKFTEGVPRFSGNNRPGGIALPSTGEAGIV